MVTWRGLVRRRLAETGAPMTGQPAGQWAPVRITSSGPPVLANDHRPLFDGDAGDGPGRAAVGRHQMHREPGPLDLHLAVGRLDHEPLPRRQLGDREADRPPRQAKPADHVGAGEPQLALGGDLQAGPVRGEQRQLCLAGLDDGPRRQPIARQNGPRLTAPSRRPAPRPSTIIAQCDDAGGGGYWRFGPRMRIGKRATVAATPTALPAAIRRRRRRRMTETIASSSAATEASGSGSGRGSIRPRAAIRTRAARSA